MDYDIQRVPVDRIDTTDHTYRITTTSDKTDLIPSIRSVGMLQPSVLIEKGAEYRNNLGIAARKRIKNNFDIQKIVQQFEDTYSQLARL